MEAERLHRAVGRRLRELRRAEEGLSQESLAARAGFHRTFVGKVCHRALRVYQEKRP
jgi:ribosome-binding protein aMBF1 (putative translation factor)